MNKAKDSLKANMDEILANLPEEFQADFKKQLEDMSDSTPTGLTGEAAVAAIKENLKENPDVDETAAAAELKDIKAPVAAAQPSEAELKEQEAANLKEAEAQGGSES